MTNSLTETITSSQLEQHKTRQDLWVAVYGQVYDLTAFAEDHPGGIDVLTECAGTDATESFDFAGHTADAIDTMKRFLVGRLADASDVEMTAGNKTHASETPKEAQHTKLSKSKMNGQVASLLRRSLNSMERLPRGLALGFPILVAVVYGSTLRSHVTSRHGSGGETEGEFDLIHVVGTALTLGSLMGWVLAGYMYRQFSKTLKQERDVFSYPPVIPRIVRH